MPPFSLAFATPGTSETQNEEVDADVEAVQRRYERFARDEAPGRSELYAEWARGIAADPHTASVLARIPETHRQPPLVFAVTRLLGAPEMTYARWARWLRTHADQAVAECSARSIQTNEPQRCAALLPALSLVEGPIALLEVGASAGLCLYPDAYSYRYRRGSETLSLDPASGESPVVLHSELRGSPRLRMPEIIWRAGIDLEPRDARDPADRAWIEGLVWPGERGRVERMTAALDIAASDPPLLVAGDAREILADVASRAPRDATLVVTTPGVLAHVPRVGRGRIIATARALGRWITLDDPELHEGWNALPEPWPGGFALAVDGDVVASVDPLGASVAWLAHERAAAR